MHRQRRFPIGSRAKHREAFTFLIPYSCAAVAAMCAFGVCEKGSNVQVQLRGGTLTIRVTDEGILMSGPAETAYEGDVEV